MRQCNQDNGGLLAARDWLWQRHVFDDKLQDGHTLVTGDFDGMDEIMGCRPVAPSPIPSHPPTTEVL
jgi:hypothetical protein